MKWLIRLSTCWSLLLCVLSLSVFACSSSSQGDGRDITASGIAAQATAPSPSATPTAIAPASESTATVPATETATVSAQEATATISAFDATATAPEPEATRWLTPEEFHASFSAEELLQRAKAQLEYITSAHTKAEIQVSGVGSNISSVVETQFDKEAFYRKQQTFGFSVELLQRSGEVCVRQAGGEWQAGGQTFSPPSEQGLGVLDGLLDFAYTSLRRLPDGIAFDGRKVYVIEAELASSQDVSGLPDLSETPDPATTSTLDSGTVQIMLEWATVFVVSIRIDAVVTIQGSQLQQTSVLNIDRQNLPARFPEDLPDSCSTLTS
jgi:hypothetical protein